MPLTRAYEEHEVRSDVGKIFDEVRNALNLPFVPTLFKLSAGAPEYLGAVWADLHEVACAREFHAAAHALAEFTHSQVIHAGWQMSDQHRVLSGMKFPLEEEEIVAMTAGIFAKATPEMLLFARLMQLGFSGGQRGRVSGSKEPRPLGRWYTLYVPPERQAGLRTWLIYSDIKRTTGSRNVMSIFRVLSPYPAYLSSVWVDAKKLLQQPGFRRAADDVARRSRALLSGLPVRDHHKLARGVSPQQWREIEETVDGFVRILPQFALFAAVWQRSFERLGYRAPLAA